MEKVSWNFELNVIKEYLSKFYSSDFACIREYVANAIAAQHRAGVKDPVYVEITPERIVVEDRGIGITREKFKEVFMWFGRSENREIEGVQGRFGLGAKSFMMLTGENGRVVMKTRSRETGEAYSAILTTTGAEITDGDGKDDCGTRFEIYPEKLLTPEKIAEYYNGLAKHFDFSRIPVRVRAVANQPFRICITDYTEEVRIVEDDRNTKKVTLVEAVFGEHNHVVEVIEENDVYVLGILKTTPYHELEWSYRRNHTAVVVGDVLVSESGIGNNTFIRIKVEDGREAEVLGVKVRTPEPLPNRDGYRGLEKFLELLGLQYRIRSFVEEGHARYLTLSPASLAKYGRTFLKNLQDAVVRLKGAASKGWTRYGTEYDEELLQAIERALPGFAKLEKTVNILLTELPAYGAWGFLESNGRRTTVSVAHILSTYKPEMKVGYVRKRPNARKEKVMEEEGIYAVYTEDPELIQFLEAHGIRELKVRDSRVRVKVYRSLINGSFEGGEPEYVGLENLLFSWKGEVFIYAEKVSNLKGKYLPPCRVIVGSKALYRKLKELFGEFVMTYDEFVNFVRETTIVTDGYEVMTLEESEDFDLILMPNLPLLPVLREATGFNFRALLDITDYTYAENIFRTRSQENVSGWLYVEGMAERIGRKAAEALHLFLNSGNHYNSIRDDLMEIVFRYAGIEKGRTEEELKEMAKPLVEEILKKHGVLKLGKYPVKAFMYRGPIEKDDLDGITAEGVGLVNPLIPSRTYDLAGKAGEDLKKLRELQSRFDIFGALVYHAEKGGKLNGESAEVSAREIVEKYLPMFARSKEDWALLVKLAPMVSKKLALSVLL